MPARLLPLTILGDVGVDVVLGPLTCWPQIGTESLMDRSELRAGGSAGNTALAVSYLGAEAHLLSLVGDDDLGSWLQGQLRALQPSLAVCDSPTSVTVGFVHPCGERTFFTTRGHLEILAYEHVRPGLAAAAHVRSIVLLCGVFLTPGLRKSYERLIDEIAALGHEVALDTGWPPGSWNEPLRREVLQWVGKCDHVLLNELEVASLADCPDLREAIARIAAVLKPGASLIVKTGARGALGFQSGATLEQRAARLAVFDTIGAGDSFNAGYLLARLHGYGLSQALSAGCNAAASIIACFPRRQIRPGEFAGRIALAGAAPEQAT
ncbi:MAG TPA: carbohydrate kinase family protein [Steroidobacteraceae bacterium]